MESTVPLIKPTSHTDVDIHIHIHCLLSAPVTVPSCNSHLITFIGLMFTYAWSATSCSCHLDPVLFLFTWNATSFSDWAILPFFQFNLQSHWKCSLWHIWFLPLLYFHSSFIPFQDCSCPGAVRRRIKFSSFKPLQTYKMKIKLCSPHLCPLICTLKPSCCRGECPCVIEEKVLTLSRQHQKSSCYWSNAKSPCTVKAIESPHAVEAMLEVLVLSRQC
jgi:hypothetical protein